MALVAAWRAASGSSTCRRLSRSRRKSGSAIWPCHAITSRSIRFQSQHASTLVPSRGLGSTRPLAARAFAASRTPPRLTSSRSARSASFGSWLPGSYSPDTIHGPSHSTTQPCIVRWGPSETTIGLSPLRQLHWPIIESLIHKESAEDHRRGDHGLGECACSTTSAGTFRTKPLNFRFTSCSAVRCTPDEFHTAAKRVTAHGYLALKPDPFGTGMFELDPTQTARSLALAEEAVGHRRDAPPADGAAQRGRADFDGRRPAPGRDHGQPQDPGVLNDFADPLAADCEPGLPEVVDGYFPLPTAPGLGISLDRDAIAAHPRQRVNVNLFRSGSELREATAGQAG